MQHVAYIALGSNLGDRQQNFERAMEALSRVRDSAVTASSPQQMYPAQNGRPGQPDYLNGVVALATDLNPFALQEELQKLEASMGRPAAEVRQRHEDRTIDLDLLLYDQAVIVTPRLIVPHPRMHRRRFVLEPLCSIAPDVLHPALGLTARQLLDRLLAGPEAR